jgi:hypothetical protein
MSSTHRIVGIMIRARSRSCQSMPSLHASANHSGCVSKDCREQTCTNKVKHGAKHHSWRVCACVCVFARARSAKLGLLWACWPCSHGSHGSRSSVRMQCARDFEIDDCKHEIVAIGCMAQVVQRTIRGKRTRENGCDVRCDAALRVAGWSLASANHLLAYKSCKRWRFFLMT